MNMPGSELLIKRSALILLTALIGATALATPPGELSISYMHRAGRHLDALHAFEGRSAVQITLEDRLAAAKSAWALGLSPRARQLWDEALRDPRFSGIERSRELLGRAILELQEGKFNDAVLLAEEGARGLPPSTLRAQLWMVCGEALKAQEALRQATEYFERAVDEADGETKSEALYQLGECQWKSGLSDEARYSFTAIANQSPLSVHAIRRLIEVDLLQRKYEGVLTWLEEGRASFPAEFFDGWSFHAAVAALVGLGRLEAAGVELGRFRIRHAEGDHWFALAAAAVEGARVRSIVGSTKLEGRR